VSIIISPLVKKISLDAFSAAAHSAARLSEGTLKTSPLEIDKRKN
jgi:hypothetical protein